MSEWKETDFGKIPIHWDLKKIINLKSDDKRAIAMGPFGSNIKAENFVESGVPVIRGTNLNYAKFVDGEFVFLTDEKADELIGSNCKAGDLVFTHRGTIGQVGLIPSNKYPRYVISQSGMKLTVNPELISNEFLFYFFKSEFGQYQILKYESQVGVPSISNPLTSLKEIEVPVPPLPEQTAIAFVLSSLDDKIDLLHRQNATLEKMAETLFRQWFVEEAKEEWEMGRLGDLIQPKKGKNITKSEAVDGEFPVVAGGLEPSCYHNQSNTKSPVITVSASGANAGFVRLYNTPVWSSDSSYIDETITPYVYFFYVFLKINQDLLFDKQEGSAQPHIYPSHIMELEILNYQESVIGKFENEVKPMFQKIKSNQTQIRTLTALRDTLLPKLMSGEVRVKMN